MELHLHYYSQLDTALPLANLILLHFFKVVLLYSLAQFYKKKIHMFYNVIWISLKINVHEVKVGQTEPGYLNLNKLGVTFFNNVKHISGTKHQT